MSLRLCSFWSESVVLPQITSRDHFKRPRLDNLPTEILHLIFWQSLEPALNHTCHLLKRNLPSYPDVVRKVAALALCCGDPAEADSVQKDAFKAFGIPEAGLTLEHGQLWKYDEFQKTFLRSQKSSSSPAMVKDLQDLVVETPTEAGVW